MTDWPITMETFAAELTVSTRQLGRLLSRLDAKYPGVVFYTPVSRRKKVFYRQQHDAVLEHLPCLNSTSKGAEASGTSAARSRSGTSADPYNKTTKVRVGDLDETEKLEAVRHKEYSRIKNEILYGESAVTWTEAAAHYCERRRERLEHAGRLNPDDADPEAHRVLDLTDFFVGRGLADRPLRDIAQADIDAYFRHRHFDRGNKLVTAERDASTYCAVMNLAARAGWVRANYPRPNLPTRDVLKQPVNKWLYPEEIRLFIELAAPHFRPIVAVIFGTGRRSGPLPFVKRTPPDYQDPNTAAVMLDGPNPHIYFGRTKNGDPEIADLPDWVVAELKGWLATRKDNHDALFLTDKGRPYKKPRRQQGGLTKNAWRGLRARVAREIRSRAEKLERAGHSDEARFLRERAKVVEQATPHWGRHNAASHLFMQGRNAAQVAERVGWRDSRMARRYTHLSTEMRREMANWLDFTAEESEEIEQAKNAAS
jgi:integrase